MYLGVNLGLFREGTEVTFCPYFLFSSFFLLPSHTHIADYCSVSDAAEPSQQT